MTVLDKLPADIQVSMAFYHITTVAGVTAYPASPDLTVTGGFMPLSTKQRALLGGDLTMSHVAYVEVTDDVREADKVVIGGAEYRVSHIDTYDFGGHAHKQAVLSKPE